MTYKEMQEMLMKELRLYHYPIAVKFFFDQEELDAFKSKATYVTPVKPTTFCQWEIAARMKGQTVLGTVETQGCSNARYNFGWKEFDEAEVKSHAKYTRDLDQAARFVKSKICLPKGLLGIVVAPLGDIDGLFEPDTVHFYCDNMQAYHLAIDWMAATDITPMRSNITINSSACAGNVYAYNEQLANMLPACSGSYNAGKTERGEINFILPEKDLRPLVAQILKRKEKYGSAAVTRPGDGFPGADICKNCPLIVFKKGK